MSKKIQDHYNDLTSEYTGQYDRERILKKEGYIANYFRLQHVMNVLSTYEVKSILDAGCGEASPMIVLSKAGYDVTGFDFSSKMVKKAKSNLRSSSFPEDKVTVADITDILTFSHLGEGRKFDASIALGVLPHVENEILALKNLKTKTKHGGLVIVEFRNKLFNMFALNAISKDFYMDELFFGIKELPKGLGKKIAADIEKRFAMKYPKKRIKNPGSNAPGYDAILSKFHNPFEIPSLFRSAGIKFVENIFYHYHPYPPYYEHYDPKTFMELSAKLEHESSDWKGHFMASAFLALGTTV